MRLASLKGGRDGRLVVVSRDLRRMLPAEAVAPTLQAALDDWARCAPQLAALAERLEPWNGEGEPFDEAAAPRRCRAPTSGPTARPT
jgi:fumarylacetoacetate (FAA) hydrolase